MVTEMRALTILIAFCLFSSSLSADVIGCSGKDIKQKQLGDFGTIDYGQSVSLKEVLQVALTGLSKEAELLSRVQPLPNETESYVQEAIALLEGSGGLYSCFVNNLQPKDVIIKFTEVGGSETRKGFMIMRENKPVAYFYESIVNI
jgi:hypothetical protein